MIWNFNPNDLYTAAIAVAAGVPAFRKFVPALKKAEPVVENVVKDAVHLVKDAAQFPVVAELEARLKEQGKQLEAQTRESNLYRIVAATTHELGVDVSKAGPDLKSMVAVAASTFAKQALGMSVTTDEVLTTIDDIQRFGTSVGAHPAVQAIKQLATSATVANNVTVNSAGAGASAVAAQVTQQVSPPTVSA